MPSAAPPIMAARSLMSRNGPRGFYVGPARAVEGATRPPRAQARRLQWWPTEDRAKVLPQVEACASAVRGALFPG